MPVIKETESETKKTLFSHACLIEGARHRDKDRAREGWWNKDRQNNRDLCIIQNGLFASL